MPRVGTIVAGVTAIVALTLAAIVTLSIIHDQMDIPIVVGFVGPTLLSLVTLLKVEQVHNQISNGSMDTRIKNAVQAGQNAAALKQTTPDEFGDQK